ncbi:hypothetical protein [Mucilaginibacter sp. KACC 22063]|uniref:hypothetical protein n=1 Tax=Mucilaginibacter sp. KACC 22063 TaxID=3025666 RepID=UPI002365543D|nr:hypothetical protein [Mucilaginibacter sp. KACC 22063]WDF57174.1 hypothetical protein PQ461_08920 [Mucilaginibacter sp. KACC 22063]
MKSGHLNDEELQQAAENPELRSGLIQRHLNQCADCRLKVENYSAIETGLAHTASPAFDFDLAAQVMAALPVRKAPYYWLPTVAGILGGLSIIGAIAVAYNRLSSLWDSLPSPLVYLAVIPALVLLVLQLLITYKDHRRKMDTFLNA